MNMIILIVWSSCSRVVTHFYKLIQIHFYVCDYLFRYLWINLPLNGGGEVTVGRNHDHGAVSLGGTGNHVLNEVAVTRGIDDGVVPLLREELLRRAPELA